MPKWTYLALAVAITLIVGAPASLTAQAAAPELTPDEQALYDRGLEVYRESFCGICHALAAADTHGTFGPPHDSLGVIAAARLQDPNYRGNAGTAREYLLESILEPQVYIVPGYASTHHHMPAYTQLEDEDLEALVLMLAHQ